MFIATTATNLTYNIVEGLLLGVIDAVHINAQAVSGGRAGSKLLDVVNPWLANNPYATRVKKGTKRPGGPLIMGKYWLQCHESRANWLRLIPYPTNAMGNRNGFAIHGRGNRGSDGCIVPTDFNVVLKLYSLVQTREASRLAAPSLAVIAIGDIDSLDTRLRTLEHTA